MLGAGSWGTALAILVARNGHPVRLWGHDAQHIAKLCADWENAEFLPGHGFPQSLLPCASMAEALSGAEVALLVVPSHAFRDVLRQAVSARGLRRVAWATKGFEHGSAKLLDQVVREVAPDVADCAVVSGPTFATEVAANLPAAVTVAGSSNEMASRVARFLHGERFRVYTSTDLTGVQLGGAVKNVLAIAAGIADGLGFGANTRAALITRGLAEIMRLGEVMGAQRDTLMGLAGLGDLVLTCTDNQSRNRRFGLALARGRGVEQAIADIGQVVEGHATSMEVMRLARRHSIEMPICEQTFRVLHEQLAPFEAVQALLRRDPKPEFDAEST